MHNVHPEHLPVYEAAQATRKKVMPILFREQQALKDKGFPTSAFSSMATGINLPDEGASDIDLVVRSPTKDLSHVSKELEKAGLPFTKKHKAGFHIHSYKTPEGIEVEVKVFEPHVFDYQKKGFQRIADLPHKDKAEIVYNKHRLKSDPEAYKKYKDDTYLLHGVHAPNDVYPELEKEAALSEGASKILAVAPIVLGAGLTIYDFYKVRGYNDDVYYVSDTLRGKKPDHKMVDLTSYAKRNFQGVTVVDTPDKFHEFLKKETKLAQSLPEKEARSMSKDIFKKLTKSNAAAASGKHGNYLIAAEGKIPQDILEHELGHLRDFKQKKITTTDGSYNHYVKGFFDSLAQDWIKSRYMGGKYLEEVNAWDKAKQSKSIDKVREHALGTYEKHFHLKRGVRTTMAMIAYLLGNTVLKGARPQDHLDKFARALTNKERAEAHHSSDSKDWKSFEDNLKSKGFQKEIAKHQMSDEKLKEYAKNYGAYLSSRKVVGKVPSRTGSHSYELRKLPGGRVGCGCRDWQYKHSWKGTDCDHIQSAKEKVSGANTDLLNSIYYAAKAMETKREGEQAERYVKSLGPRRKLFPGLSELIAKNFI